MVLEAFALKEAAFPAEMKDAGRTKLPDDSGRRPGKLELPGDGDSKLERSNDVSFKELPANAEYESKGYKYRTDDQGRIVSAEGQLRIKEHQGRLQIPDSMGKIGRGYEMNEDDRGHLIGDQFDGSNRLDNLVPMNKDLNRGDYKKMECELASAVKDGKEVYLKVEPRYEGESARPSMFKATNTIDDEKSIRYFNNEGR